MPPAPRRSRRFTLPADSHDARTSARIEAFIDGQSRPARRRNRRGPTRPHRPIDFASTSDWDAAIRREEIRVARYGRQATLVIVDLLPGTKPTLPGETPLDECVEPIAEVIRVEARETDRVARVGATRFRMLLPETAEVEAGRFVERLTRACWERLNGHGDRLRLRVEALTPGHGTSLSQALGEVETRLDT